MGPRTRAVTHVLVTVVLVLLASGSVAGLSLVSLAGARAQLGSLTARAQGHITAVDQDADTAHVSWTLPDGREASAAVDLASGTPKVGTQVPVGYDPSTPSRAVIPGAELLVGTDRAGGELLFITLVVALVLVITAVRALTRVRLPRRPGTHVRVRRVRVQAGLMARSWLETEDLPRRWIPVHFDPVLVTLPTPSTVTLHGDPRTQRLVAASVEGVTLYPSGLVARTEPRGRRVDNPSEVDSSVRSRAVSTRGFGHQLRADAVLLVPTPMIGLLWAYLDGGGAWSWLGATVMTATLALWLAALRGSDPS
jgi:Protein of unknown function (DUF3592)